MKKFHTYKKTEIIESIIDMRINKGMTTLDIRKYLVEQLGYGANNAYKLIQSAQNEITSLRVNKYEEHLEEDIQRFEALYHLAVNNKDIKEANNILKEIAKLKGHYVERQEINLTTTIPQVIEINLKKKGE